MKVLELKVSNADKRSAEEIIVANLPPNYEYVQPAAVYPNKPLAMNVGDKNYEPSTWTIVFRCREKKKTK